MRAIAIDKFGKGDVLKLKEVPTPVPGDDEVLIKVAYAGVNPVDWKIRVGMLAKRLPCEFPLIPGWDAAGTIAKCGKNVTKWREGDEVYSYCRKPTIQWGTYAEYVAVPHDFPARKPKNLSFRDAAAVPLAALTAWQSLFEAIHLKKRESILIHAGAGGVGSFAIQFARWAGAQVVTTASSKNHGYVRELGAEHAIDYTKGDFATPLREIYPDGVDAVYDCVGGDVFSKSYPCLKKGGRINTIATQLDPELDKKYGVTGTYTFVRPNGSQLKEIADLIQKGAIRSPALQEYRLEEAAKAHAALETLHTRGKIVLRVS
ncbi:MAG: NADP-dependent oxidoreductase [Pseudomonadota bacterium]